MQTDKSQSYLIFSLLIVGIYFFTGLTALSYEVLWARMLSTIFGVSTFGVVVTISAFMAGLGIGSLLGGKLQNKIQNPLLIFGLIEISVALFAFNLPSLFSNLDQFIQTSTSGSSYSFWILIQAVTTFILMFIPALGLGFGFPLILKSVSKSNISLGIVYSLNTLGGMTGALLPLLLLPAYGWIVADRLVAVFGIFLGLMILIIAYFVKFKPSDIEKKSQPISSLPNWKVLTAYACVGASAIMLEIAWTRLYGMILLRTEYVMAVILATFLLGIGIGSLLAIRASHNRWLYIMPLVIAITALVSVYLLPALSAWTETANYSSLLSSMFQQSSVIALFTLPATLAFGAWLPILVSRYNNFQTSGSFLYGANAIGGSVGGLIAGFLLIPNFGTIAVISISAVVVLMASTFWVKNKWYKVSPIIVALLFIPVLDFPQADKLLPLSHANSVELEVYEDALMVTHVVEDKTGQRLLLADLQRMDASTAPDAVTVQKNQSRLPLMFHSEPQSVLFLGLGTGITASGSAPYSALNRTAVELSNGAIDAASRWFSESNENIISKLTIIKDDARRFLKSTNENYDVIIGDLFHPDLIGRSNLLSVQQFNRAKHRLSEDGIFVQWIALNQFDIPTLKVVFATFKSAFPDGRLFVDGFRVALVGVNGPFQGIQSLKQNISKLSAAQMTEITGGEGIWSWLGRYWGTIPENNWSIQDEWAPVIEFQLPRAKFNRQLDLGQLLNFMLSIRSSKTEAATSLKISDKDLEYFEAGYLASVLYYKSWLAYFTGKNLESQKLLSMAYATNSDDQWIAFGMADAMFASLDQAIKGGISEMAGLTKILSIRPDHIPALKRLLSIAVREQNSEEISRIKQLILTISPLDKEAA